MSEVARFAQRVAVTGKVDAAQISELRRSIYADGIVSREDAEVLFEIDRARQSHNGEWSQMYVEALTDYALNREPPAGYLSDDTAGWLIGQITKRNIPATDTEIALLVNIIENARQVTPAFSAYALRLVKDMVIYADGTDARGRTHGGIAVTAADVDCLRRILWGAGCEGHLAISRDEAEALFAIADASTGADNHPDFDDLFARAVGNYLLGASGRSVPSRDVALRRETELPYRKNVLGMLARTMASASTAANARFVLDTIGGAFDDDLDVAHEKAEHARDLAADAAGIMTADKAAWLLDHVGRNGTMTAPEKALVRFVAREAVALDPSLASLVHKIA